jgi:succinyl-diaminopimelate desuccinylase
VSYESKLLLKLVAIDTSMDKRKNCFKIAGLIVREAKKAGLSAEKVVTQDGIPHVIITFPNAPKNGKKIIFLTHYDVVPAGEGWEFEPFNPFIMEGKLFGRGAADDKSNIVATVGAFKEALIEELRLKVNPILIIRGGEESGQSAEIFRKLDGDICVVLDAGCETLSIGASGFVRVSVKVKGKQAHSAYPYKGQNAIYGAARIVSFIEDWGKELERNTLSRFYASTHYNRLPARMSVTVIKGGIAENIIPEECEIIIDRRTIPEENVYEVAREIKTKIEQFAKEHGINADVRVKSCKDAWCTNDEEVVAKFKNILARITGKQMKLSVELGGTDGAFVIGKMPVIQYGTMRDDNNIHGKNEFVYLEDLGLIKKFVKEIITTSF